VLNKNALMININLKNVFFVINAIKIKDTKKKLVYGSKILENMVSGYEMTFLFKISPTKKIKKIISKIKLGL
jgi:hypothetical protein